MATDNFVQPVIPRFDGHYDHWSLLMENFLRSKEYWHIVSDRIAVTSNQHAYLRFHEEVVPRFRKSKEAAALSTSFGVRNTTNEIGRISHRLVFMDDDNRQQDVDP
ncbi:hypothetical protein JRO89_XS04G0062700 [Xanthoceras sorbifolium]|uniref:DUF4219 domain-containing protein n=1 Tax=Xanthoceras sorbifolium TaxID=99658 RepID=A0ABQ8I4D0_9ROSI|nr:hypothetical protein JRO89_XS04G0062700 [Xanthoceras sorbifolium]